MLLQIKIYLVAVLYFFGIVFMILFPPRNFVMSGAKIRTIRSISNNVTLPSFITPNMFQNVIDRLASNNEEVAKVVRLTPPTAQNRNIMALELRSDRLTKKPGILIVGELNAMAWTAPNAILELAEKLVYDPGYQAPFFNDYDWYLIPMGNPDGLHYAQSISHLPPIDTNEWSKNVTLNKYTRPREWFKNVEREKDSNGLCFGTNINRNFAYHWQDDVRTTPDVCSQFYPGEKPFTTAEARAIRRYVDNLGDKIQLAIHLHASFIPKKEYILYPWRYSQRQPSNFKILQEIGEYAARQARLSDGRLYEVHQSSSDNKVAGSFSDYVCGVVGIDLVFIIKPYHEKFPNNTDVNAIAGASRVDGSQDLMMGSWRYQGKPSNIVDTYVKKSLRSILSLVRGWRSSTKLNTLSFFGRDVEF